MISPRVLVALVGAVCAALLAEGAARLHGDVLCTDTPGAVYQADERLGWRFVPDLYGVVGACAGSPVPWVPFETDTHGLAGPERSYEKPPDTMRVLLLGGNLAAGLGVRPEATFPRLLEGLVDRRKGSGLEVVNGGVGGYALDNDLVFFRDVGRRYAPDVVVVLVDAPSELIALSPAVIVAGGNRAPRKPYFRVVDGQLTLAPAYAPAPVPASENAVDGNPFLRPSALYRVLHALPPRTAAPMEWADVPVPVADDDRVQQARDALPALATALLTALRDETAASGARLVTMIAAQGGTPGRSIGWETHFQLRDIAKDLGIPTVDVAADFSIAEKQGYPTYLPGSARWNGRGHMIAALSLFRFLRDGGYLPPTVVPASLLGGGAPVPSWRELPAAAARLLHDVRWALPTQFVVYGLLAAAVMWMAAPLRPIEREWLLVVVSAAVFAGLAGARIAGGALLFALVFYLAVERLPRIVRTVIVTLLCGGLVAATVALRQEHVPGEDVYFVIFLALAGNVALLRLVAYAVDRAGGGPRPPLRAFLLGLFYFPAVVAGPIESPCAVGARGPLADPDDAAATAPARAAPWAVLRLARGILQLAVLVVLLNKITPEVFASGGTAVGRGRLWLWVFELFASLTLLLGGWTDVAVALGMLAGVRPTENFRRPLAATDPADFWRRWHVSFGRWLHDYVYVPLGGPRRRVPGVVAVFLVSALWSAWAMVKVIGFRHYPPPMWGGFLVWAILNAALVLALGRNTTTTPRNVAVRVLLSVATFVLICLAWIPFFLPGWQTPWDPLESTCRHASLSIL